MNEQKPTLKEKLSTTTSALTPAAAMHSICCGLPALTGAYAGKQGTSALKEQTINNILQAGEATGIYQATPAVYENPQLKHAHPSTIADKDLQLQTSIHQQNHDNAHTIYHGLELAAMIGVGLAAHKINKKYDVIGKTKNYFNTLRSTNP